MEELRFKKKLPKNILTIEKDLLPYDFTLDGRFYYYLTANAYDNTLRCTLYDRQEKEGSGEIIGSAQNPFILDFPIFWVLNQNADGRRNENYPILDLVARSADLKDHSVTLDNINNTILICVE